MHIEVMMMDCLFISVNKHTECWSIFFTSWLPDSGKKKKKVDCGSHILEHMQLYCRCSLSAICKVEIHAEKWSQLVAHEGFEMKTQRKRLF